MEVGRATWRCGVVWMSRRVGVKEKVLGGSGWDDGAE